MRVCNFMRRLFHGKPRPKNRVLDIDLDSFLDSPSYPFGTTGRAPADKYRVWPNRDVVRFLGRNCRLSASIPTPGRLVTHHHEAFTFWKEMIESGDLVPPFEIVHVDAHADLGLGVLGWEYLMGDILHRDIADRANPVSSPDVFAECMNIGNYLCFALACRWVSRLVYVYHPARIERRRLDLDLEPMAFKNKDLSTNALQLKKCDPALLRRSVVTATDSANVLEVEPEVPFNYVSMCHYRNKQPFSCAVLSRSPEYTTPSADALIPVIMRYFEER